MAMVNSHFYIFLFLFNNYLDEVMVKESNKLIEGKFQKLQAYNDYIIMNERFKKFYRGIIRMYLNYISLLMKYSYFDTDLIIISINNYTNYIFNKE